MTRLLVLLLTTMIAGCSSFGINSPQPPIAIDSVRLTAAGHYLDLRYRVIDPERANSLLGPGVKPTLIDEQSGVVMAVPTTAKLGPLRQTYQDQRTSRQYFVLFVNSARLQPGNQVTANMGGYEFAHLTVQ